MRRVVLIGYRATGKSSVGQELARGLGLPFVDSDREFERRQGRSIAAVFANEGEGAFRRGEAALLAELLAAPGEWVLATGGGAVLVADSRRRLRESGALIVWLDTDDAELAARLRKDAGGRPALQGVDPAVEVAAVLTERRPLYRALADLRCDVGAAVDFQVLAAELATIVEKRSESTAADDLR